MKGGRDLLTGSFSARDPTRTFRRRGSNKKDYTPKQLAEGEFKHNNFSHVLGKDKWCRDIGKILEDVAAKFERPSSPGNER
jgi:hypothetical protein